jgi:hypothetical protein
MKTTEIKMDLAVIPQDFLDKMEAAMNELKAILQEKNEEEINSVWIESVKIPKILGISQKTWQTYRDRRIIPFAQIGSKIFVKRADLEEFMKSHYIEAKL